MGWWGYHTNDNDKVQDVACEIEEELEISSDGFFNRIPMILGQSNNVDDNSDQPNQWWEKRHEIAKLACAKHNDHSYIIAGIAWQLFKNSPGSGKMELPADYPERLRKAGLKGAKNFQNEGEGFQDEDEFAKCIQEEIDIFSKKIDLQLH